MTVVDASVIVHALLAPAPAGRRTREWIRSRSSLVAPSSLDVEVLSAVRRLVHAGRIGPDVGARALGDLQELEVERFPVRHLIAGAFDLRQNLTAYDAVYAVLAHGLGAPLATFDRALARSPRLPCTTIEPPR